MKSGSLLPEQVEKMRIEMESNRTHDLLLRSLIEGRQDFEMNCHLFKQKLADNRLKFNRFDKATIENAYKMGVDWTSELSTSKLKEMDI